MRQRGARQRGPSGTWMNPNLPPLPRVLDRDLVVVTGKGGVGKSTVAAAIALAAADRGRRTVLGEIGGRSDAAALVGGRVDCVSITAREAMEEYLQVQLP